MRRLVVLAIVVAAAFSTAAFAVPTGNVDVLKVFRKQLPTIKSKTSVPVLLPSSLPFAGPVPRLFATGSANTNSWSLELSGAPNCGGATACFFASFDAKRGGALPRKANLQLAGGQPAVYRASTCGASCTPVTLWFTYRGVLYTWQHKVAPPKNTRALLARVAAAAIKAGPR